MDEEEPQVSLFPLENLSEEESAKYVNYYFDVNVDRQIPAEELCKYIIKSKDNNIYIDEEIECPDKVLQRFDIYGTRVGPNDSERCDD